MNITILVGWAMAVGLVLYGILDGGQIGWFIDPPSIFITVGGTFGVLIAMFPLNFLVKVPKLLKIAIMPKKHDPAKYITDIVEYAKIARSKGLLALEDSANKCTDPFMKQSLMLIVDANDPDKVRKMLEDAIDFTCERHAKGRAFFEKGGAMGPAFGMIGTLVGLVNMLKVMGSSSDGLGESMATALITTFYGSLLANVLFAPIENALRNTHDEEVLCMQIIVEGVMSIAAGSNPRLIQEKLEFMLPKSAASKDKGAKPSE